MKIINSTTSLRRLDRENKNAYIERPILSLDEEVMAPGRNTPRLDQSK